MPRPFRLPRKKQENHGLTGTPIHNRWQGMILRCTSPSHSRYASYGGRGIKVCSRWHESLLAFIEDMGFPPSPNFSIERINNNGDYEPSNCRWATRSEQRRNMRPFKRSRYIGFGKTMSRSEWARHFSVSNERLRVLLRKNDEDIEKVAAVLGTSSAT